MIHNINYKKTKLTDLGDISQCNINNYGVKDLQQYNPIYSVFFNLHENNYNNIQLNHKYHIVNHNQILNTETNCIETSDVFIKYAPLLDPIRYMIGKYDETNCKIKDLPTILSTTEICDEKLINM